MNANADYTNGQLVPGTPYRVNSCLGAGGMGVVYEVEDTSVERVYVLKTLRSVNGSSTSLAALLRKEAKTLGKFKHPNIVEVYTAGETTDGVAFFVMEKLDGCTLGALLSGVGPLPFSFVLQIGREICDALYYVHNPGKGAPVVIHRDIKPENIFLAKVPNRAPGVLGAVPYLVKLLDFGISAVVDEQRSKGFHGTLLYAAPEQLLEEPLSPSVDIYALGCVLFQMLTGRHPFADARTEAELIQCQLTRVPDRLSAFLEVPQAVDACIAAALEKRAADRPRDAHAMLRALQALEGAQPRPAFGCTTIQDLHTAIEKNAPAGYELYATAVGATLGPLAPAMVLAAPAPPAARRAASAGVGVTEKGVEDLLAGLAGVNGRSPAQARGEPGAERPSPPAAVMAQRDVRGGADGLRGPVLAALPQAGRTSEPLHVPGARERLSQPAPVARARPPAAMPMHRDASLAHLSAAATVAAVDTATPLAAARSVSGTEHQDDTSPRSEPSNNVRPARSRRWPLAPFPTVAVTLAACSTLVVAAVAVGTRMRGGRAADSSSETRFASLAAGALSTESDAAAQPPVPVATATAASPSPSPDAASASSTATRPPAPTLTAAARVNAPRSAPAPTSAASARPRAAPRGSERPARDDIFRTIDRPLGEAPQRPAPKSDGPKDFVE